MDEQFSLDFPEVKSEKTSTFTDGPSLTPETQPRRATIRDLDEAEEAVKNFVSYGIYSGIGTNDHLRDTLIHLIVNGVVFLHKGGIIAGAITPMMFNSDYRIACEVCWWAPNGGGTELRKAFEEWATEEGANAAQMSAMNSESVSRVDKIYRRAGYAPVEIGYLKELK